jgi:hypothetical protein
MIMVMQDDTPKLTDISSLTQEQAVMAHGMAWKFPLRKAVDPFFATPEEKRKAEEYRFTIIRQQLEELERINLKALREAEQRTREMDEALDRLRARASVDRDGRHVYRTKDGQKVFYEDGTEVKDASGINWKDNSPTWEEHQAASEAAAEALRRQKELEEYRQHIDDAKNNGRPLSAEEVSNIKSAASEYVGKPLPSAPDLNTEFLAQAAPEKINNSPAKPLTFDAVKSL